MEESKLIGPKEMAKILNVPIGWIYQKTCLGKEAIPFIKIGKYVRFNAEEVVEFYRTKENANK